MSYASQTSTQWCWAACIQMVFAHYGYHVDQRRIVLEAWGSLVNMPGSAQQILGSINRPWMDDAGRPFMAFGDSFSANPGTAAQDLASSQPLIIGTMGHAMVLTALTYEVAPNGFGRVMSAVVRDPWPGRGRRPLSADEWHRAQFLARVRVR